jgi:hypothetical protein
LYRSRRPIEDLDAKRSFFQQVRPAGQRVLDDVSQQRRVALAAAEMGTGQNLMQRQEDRISILLVLRMPSLPSSTYSAHLNV